MYVFPRSEGYIWETETNRLFFPSIPPLNFCPVTNPWARASGCPVYMLPPFVTQRIGPNGGEKGGGGQISVFAFAGIFILLCRQKLGYIYLPMHTHTHLPSGLIFLPSGMWIEKIGFRVLHQVCKIPKFLTFFTPFLRFTIFRSH